MNSTRVSSFKYSADIIQYLNFNCVVFYDDLFHTGGTLNSAVPFPLTPSMHSLTSSDGETWIGTPNSVFDWTTGNVINDLAWGNNTWVAVGGTPASAAKASFSSDDGVTWQETDTGITGSILGIAYGAGKFLVVGQEGQICYSTSISASSISWTKVTNPNIPSNEEINDVTYSAELGMFVAVAHDNKAARSSDGINWTAITMPFSSTGSLICVGSGGGKLVIGGTENKAAYSSDGITWKQFANSTAVFGTNAIHGIAYGNGKFIAVGTSGRMALWDGNE